MSCNVRRCGLWAAIHGLVRTSPALLAAGSTFEGTALVSPVSGGVTAGVAAGGGTVAAAPAGVYVAVNGGGIAGADGAVGGRPDCTAPTGAGSGAAVALAGGVAGGEAPLAPLTSCDC